MDVPKYAVSLRMAFTPVLPVSSNSDVPIEKNVCFAAEIGLAGEIRPVQRVEQRILEADKLGFSKIFVSKNNKIALKNTKINIELVSKIEDVVNKLFI